MKTTIEKKLKEIYDNPKDVKTIKERLQEVIYFESDVEQLQKQNVSDTQRLLSEIQKEILSLKKDVMGYEVIFVKDLEPIFNKCKCGCHIKKVQSRATLECPYCDCIPKLIINNFKGKSNNPQDDFVKTVQDLSKKLKEK